ncbi:preprotein translocase subunit SecA [Roseobacter sp. GAI101]|uniref:preprotein translocase subunit SecA n=1 Tax=Roseobacter sp. (strain GAI101) TaxID=391589 RepID=UPI0003026D2A|nr:preprotein translocase subunit SecA [Roseobacter sp. GAI101]
MSERMILRPGLLGGFYPERSDERLSTPDRIMAAAYGRLQQMFARRPVSKRLFLMRVKRAGRKLQTLSNQELTEMRIALTEDLRLNGLVRANTAKAFALVREASGRVLGMRHFDVQLVGGLIMLQGQIAEMATGEGKTLTATLTAAVMAMSGVPVHLVTVNDFLASRDAEWMGPLFQFLGLSVGVILEDMEVDDRRAAYACDITYCTNNQLTFDYLKDRLILEAETRPLHMALEGLLHQRSHREQVMMRGLCFAIVDEADSVLVDEARTPLIIAQKGDTSEMETIYRQAINTARAMQTPRDFSLSERDFRIEFTDLGKAQLRRATRQLGGVWATETHREELGRQALSALWLYKRDKHYLVQDESIQIVDEYTGRIMADRSWERGLHQMIEVKEGVDISMRQETLIRISYQKFFRRYIRLSGMTGTAQEVAGELSAVYRLRTRRVPTNKRSKRWDKGAFCYATADYKWQAVLREVVRRYKKGRPILIGTQSVDASEHLSALLTAKGLQHRVLNARQNEAESEIIAEAGQSGRITVATNMAGRGTDIALDDAARAAGGLHVIATGRHDAARIDRQLYGRAARQGDPGSHVTFVSLEDDLMRVFYGRKLRPLIAMTAWGRGWVPGFIARPSVNLAQWASEKRNSGIRKSLLKADDSLDELLAFSGRGE